jgi:hypothetical protein
MPSSQGHEALIAQVGGAGRWSQIAFTFDVVRNYFGTAPDRPYAIRLWHVLANGNLQGVETPPCIFKPNSSNWCFELGAATNMAYPGRGTRPIAVFLKKPNGDFLYRLLMPGDADYDAISKYLQINSNARPGRLQRLILSSDNLKVAWPNSPLWDQWP